MGLKYIYAGYSKCGTKTIAAAFRKLGFNVVDYEETMLDYRLRWNDYLHPGTTPAEKSKIVQKMYESVDIVFDVPHYFLWKELMDAFPDAKCIFWAREEDSWWNSFHKQLQGEPPHKNDSIRIILSALFSTENHEKWLITRKIDQQF